MKRHLCRSSNLSHLATHLLRNRKGNRASLNRRSHRYKIYHNPGYQPLRSLHFEEPNLPHLHRSIHHTNTLPRRGDSHKDPHNIEGPRSEQKTHNTEGETTAGRYLRKASPTDYNKAAPKHHPATLKLREDTEEITNDRKLLRVDYINCPADFRSKQILYTNLAPKQRSVAIVRSLYSYVVQSLM